MSLLDIPKNYRTRDQLQPWAEDVYYAFVEFVTSLEYEDHEEPDPNVDGTWSGDYKYEDMNIRDIMVLLATNHYQKDYVHNAIIDANDSGKISNEISEIFVSIINGLDQFPDSIENVTTQTVKTYIFNKIYTAYDFFRRNARDAIPQHPPGTTRRDFKYFQQRFYDAIDEAMERIMTEQPDLFITLSDPTLYRAEKAGKADAQNRRRTARNDSYNSVYEIINEYLVDEGASRHIGNIIFPAIKKYILYQFCTMIPTYMTSQQLSAAGCTNIANIEDKIDAALYAYYNMWVTEDGGSPAAKRIKKSSKYFLQQGNIAPSDEPYEVPQL